MADRIERIAGEMADERRAKRQAAYEAWKTRVNEVLMLHIGFTESDHLYAFQQLPDEMPEAIPVPGSQMPLFDLEAS